MTKRMGTFMGGALAAVVVLAAAGVGGWYFFLRDDAPPEVSLAGAISAIATAQPSAAASPSPTRGPGGLNGQGGPQPGGGPQQGGGDFGVQASPNVAVPSLPSAGAAAATTGLAGTWAPDPAQASFVGYRVDEELRGIGSNTVVGRTPGVTGQAVLTANSVASAKFVADTTTLKSDNSLRDGQLRNQGIEYQKFPTSTFELTDPMSLPAGLASGQAVSVTMKGKFTLHGVTRDVSIPAQAQVVGSNLVVVGTLNIAFTDYNVTKPRGGPVLSIKDNAVMELQLILKKQ